MQYSARLDITGIKRLASDAQRKHIPVAAATALKRVATTVRNVGAVTIRQKLAVSAAVAKGALKVERSGSKLVIYIVASGKPIPLRDYQARKVKAGVSYRVARAGKRKRYRAKGRAAFIIETKGGHVFVRTEDDPPGPQKGRIRKVHGPSVPQYFLTKAIIRAMTKTARERWPIEFAAAIRGVLIRRTGVDVGATLSGLGTRP